MFAFTAPRSRSCLECLRRGQLGIRAQVQIRGLHAVVQPQRLGVDLHHLGLGKHVAAVDGVIVEARADGDHEVGLFAQFTGDVTRETAGDPDRERIVVEHAAGEQPGCKQGTALLGQGLDLGCRAGAHHPAARDDDRTLRTGELVDQLRDLMRVRRGRLGMRQDGG
jgi:hypothetical protein